MTPVAAPDRIDLVAHALADGTRRRILQLVRDDERAAGELAAEFPRMTRPAVSAAFARPERRRLGRRPRDGNRRLYLANTDGLSEVWNFIDKMWTDRLVKLKHAAEPEERRRDTRTRKDRGTP